MITKDQLDAAEEAFGSFPKQINIHKLDKTHRKILLICDDYPQAINDRPLLLAKFYESDWDNTKSLYENFTRLTRPETVVRRFRDLREWGYVKQSKEADKYNYEAMKSEREKHVLPPEHIFSQESMQEASDQIDNLIVKTYEQGSLLND